MKYFISKNGLKIPALGIGTDRVDDYALGQVIRAALDVNKDDITLIDTASVYNKHKVIGAAISDYEREKLFIVTKIFSGDLASGKSVEDIINQYLDDLGTDYIDLVLIHNPSVPNYSLVLSDLVDLRNIGKIKGVGVSNFTTEHLESVEHLHDEIECNQIEVHPFLAQPDLDIYCKERQILVTGYRPFCEGRIASDETISSLAKRHHKSNHQVALRWNINSRPTVFSTSSPDHLRASMDVFDFSLSEDECLAIDALNEGMRTCDGPWADFKNEKVQSSHFKEFSK